MIVPRVLLRADVITDEVVVLAPVAEYRTHKRYDPAADEDIWTSWSTEPIGGWMQRRSSPVDVSALVEQPCPDPWCEGGHNTGLLVRDVHPVCPTCGGKGSLRPDVGVVGPCPACQGQGAVERGSNEHGEHACSGDCLGCGAGADEACYPPCRCGVGDACICERCKGHRLRVVRYGRPTDVLPVVDYGGSWPSAVPFICWSPEVVVIEDGIDDDAIDVTTEPWAADLKPGQTVCLFDELHTCDEEVST